MTLEPSSWIRFLFLLQDVEIGNNYHQSVAADLTDQSRGPYRFGGDALVLRLMKEPACPQMMAMQRKNSFGIGSEHIGVPRHQEDD